MAGRASAAYVERICEMQAADRGLKDVLTRTFPNARALEATGGAATSCRSASIERAQAEGSLRSDFVPEDLVLVLMANAGVVQGAGLRTGCLARFLGDRLDGLRSAAAGCLPPHPPLAR